MNKIKQPESGVLSSKPSSLVTNLGGAALLAITTGFAGKTEAATLDTPVFDTPTLIAGADDSSADEYSPGVNSNTGDIAYVVPSGSNYNLTVLAAGSTTPSTVSGITDSWSPNFVDSSTLYILSGGANDVYEASTTDSWASASTSVLYTTADYEINGDFALDPDADVTALNTGELLKTYTLGVDDSFGIVDLFDNSTVVDTSDDEMQPSFATNARLLYRNDTEGAWYFHDLNGVYDDVEAIDLADCDYAAYDILNEDVICSKWNATSNDLYRYHETTYASTTVDADGDGEDSTIDCDDTNASINSSATEVCDGADNDCDGDIDGGAADASTWYIDNDGDGVGGSSTQEACDAPSGYVATGGDWDDNDASVQTEPEPGVCEEGESAEGEFETGETICGPDGSQGTVMSGTADYTVSLATLDEDQDWVEFIGSLELGETFEDRYVFNPSENSIGGFGLGISADAMLSGSHMAPPPSEGGDSTFLTLRVDQGTVTVEDKLEGTSALVEAGDVYEVALESTEGDTDTDTDSDTDTDTDSDTDTDTDTDTDADADTDSGTPDNPDDTGKGDWETPKDGGQGGCNSCASTPLPDGSLAVLGLALAGTLMRRRKE